MEPLYIFNDDLRMIEDKKLKAILNSLNEINVQLIPVEDNGETPSKFPMCGPIAPDKDLVIVESSYVLGHSRIEDLTHLEDWIEIKKKLKFIEGL